MNSLWFVVVRPVEALHALAGRFILSVDVAGLNYNPHYCDVICLLDLLLFGAACFSRGGSRAYPRPPKIARPIWRHGDIVARERPKAFQCARTRYDLIRIPCPVGNIMTATPFFEAKSSIVDFCAR